jgi:pectate lyase
MPRTLHLLTSLGIVLFVTTVAGAKPSKYLTKDDDWFATDEAKAIAGHILSHQSDLGGWPKNKDTTVAFSGERKGIKPTFDNGATTDELRFLARMVNATKTAKYRTAFDRGLEYLLTAQYANGGWPQYAPPPEKSYHRHITFNDETMVRLMIFLREVATHDRYQFVAADKRNQCTAAFDQGVECILKCQVKVNDKLTAWCAQHDEKDFAPRLGRSYELPSLSGSESVDITRLLMSIEKPSPEVIRAVEAAAAWFESAKLTGIRVDLVPDATTQKKNKVVVADPKAPPLWARFYDLKTNKPLFSGRDGVAKANLADIEAERRNGYAWYGTWPQKLLAEEYPAWQKRVASGWKK